MAKKKPQYWYINYIGNHIKIINLWHYKDFELGVYLEKDDDKWSMKIGLGFIIIEFYTYE